MHKKSKTFIKTLKDNDYMGEVGFFTETARCASVKAKFITEVIKVEREKFL